MVKNTLGIMVVLSSPSGAGKTTLTKLIANRNKNFEVSVSYTTRSLRKDEKNGKDYYFIKNKEFQKLIKNNSFYEYAEVFNNLYGTLKAPVIEKLKMGKDVLLDIDWQGTKNIKKNNLNYKLISFFILPPSVESLKIRLSRRDIKDKLIVKERMNSFKRDVVHWKDYDYVVINDDLEVCYNQIISIFNSEKKGKKVIFKEQNIKKKIQELIS